MAEIKCPKCGEIIKLDKSTYDSLLSEVEKEELDKRVQERSKLIEDKYRAQYELAANKLKNDQDKTIADLNQKIAVLSEKLSSSDKDKELSNQELKNKYEAQLQIKDEEIERWKNYRISDSTKDLGESLEQYCKDAFEELRAVAYPKAYFEKDNEVDEEGKGDFIFKDFADDGTELISIMFEMKNQKDTTKTKHKNEDFFDKLDKNRKSKGCEYAVLVSTLEEDSKLYNRGIVDVSHKYKKMFVVRPQQFTAIIGLLRSMALNNLAYKQQVIAYQKENVDITNFEAAVKEVADKIGKDYENAKAIYSEVDTMCDDIIKKVEKFRKEFKVATGWIEKANNQLPNLEVRKLTKNNPTMKEKFEEIDKK